MSEPKPDRITEARLAEIGKDWDEDSVHRRTGSVPELLAEVRRLRGLIVALAGNSGYDTACIVCGDSSGTEHKAGCEWPEIAAEAEAIRKEAGKPDA